MPHDAKGNVLNVGDKVNLPCIVRTIHQSEDYCNVDVTTVYPMPGSGSYESFSALNTRQLEKVIRERDAFELGKAARELERK